MEQAFWVGPIMIARRILLGATLGLSRAGAARAEIDGGRAADFIRSLGRELVSTFDSNEPLARRRDKVAEILRRTVDIEGVGRFILGRWWRQASPTEQQEYLRLFEATLTRNLSARFGEYRGVRFSIERAPQRSDDGVLVGTVVMRPNAAPLSLDWRVGEIGGQPKVVDMIAEGTSLRLTQRSEYSSVIQSHGGQVAALLVAMRNQLQQLAARDQGQ
jgi:phospholipid transport system substrate-binding protein